MYAVGKHTRVCENMHTHVPVEADMATAAAAALCDRDPARIDSARPLPAVQACCDRSAPGGCRKKAWAGARSAHVSISIATEFGPAGPPRADLANNMLPVRVGGGFGDRISSRIGRVGRLIQHGQLSRHQNTHVVGGTPRVLSDDNAGSDTVDTGIHAFCLMSDSIDAAHPLHHLPQVDCEPIVDWRRRPPLRSLASCPEFGLRPAAARSKQPLL